MNRNSPARMLLSLPFQQIPKKSIPLEDQVQAWVQSISSSKWVWSRRG